MPDEQTYPDNAWDLLSKRLTDRRRQRILEVVQHRTRYIRLVVQDIHDPHNVSACMRSADAFGVQDVDIVTMGIGGNGGTSEKDGTGEKGEKGRTKRSKFQPSTVARGVKGWLTWNRFDDVTGCVRHLRHRGYRIAAGLPDPDATPLYQLPLDKPIAVVFGNEHAGIHPDWRPELDLKFTIPMVGMVESLNISVSAAITMSHLTNRAKESLSAEAFYLDANSRMDLLNRWICTQTPSYQQELQRLEESGV